MSSMSVPSRRRLLFLTAFLLCTQLTPAWGATDKAGVANERLVAWQLSEARLLSPGTTSESPQGVMNTGCRIEAKAASADPRAPFPLGTFHVTLTLFSPKKDMPGQQAGRWYLRGDWSLVAFDAPPEALRVRHNPYTLKGTVTGELGFNPVQSPGELAAEVFVQQAAMKRTLGRPGGGRFEGNEKFEGILHLPPLQ
jgi:hypothetical protein